MHMQFDRLRHTGKMCGQCATADYPALSTLTIDGFARIRCDHTRATLNDGVACRLVRMIQFIEINSLGIIVLVQAKAKAHRPSRNPALPRAADHIVCIVKSSIDVNATMIRPSVEGQTDWIEARGDKKRAMLNFTHMLFSPQQ